MIDDKLIDNKLIDKGKIIIAILIIAAAVALYYQFSELMQLARVGIIIVGAALAIGLILTTETGQSAWSFIKGANVERQKVVWPTRPEAMQVTLFVIILVIIIGLVMWAFDALSFYTIYDVILRVRGT
ncbi:preprotein translocase subunit SecE [Candidatus Spongiihabitans sp.]|uniref:preprotein translocase subunit SecE n=1 Tax=Candidatus Spongiihabitans sp. TaxID=3101308 RepID=UPI003C7E007A